jgi:prepilin-type N-terminal cleavage/methylation domain-containing protein
MSCTALWHRPRGGVLANERGLTIIELMVAIAVVGILSTTATFSYAIYRDRARESNLKGLVHNLQVELLVHINDFDLKHRWGKNYDKAYLNGYVESSWENVPYDNRMGHRNPFSRSKAVLSATSVPTSGKLTQPAIFITNRTTYALKNLKPTTVVAALKGSLVVYLNNNIKTVELYYFDLAGRPSALRAIISPSN